MASKSAHQGRKHAGQEVKSRLVLNFPGFEQTDSVAQLGRLRYGAEQTGKIWGFEIAQDDLAHEEGTHHTVAGFHARGGNWNTDVRLVQFRWNDIVHAYERDSFPGGFLKNLKKYFAFFADGTVRRYRKASWRYWGFTIYPLLLAAIAFAIVFGVIWALTGSLLLNAIASLAATLFFCKWPGDKLYVPLTIADWGFARDMVNRENPEIEDRFAEFGKTVATEIAASKHDEIIIVGHSFGSLWAVTAMSLALERNPGLFEGKTVRFLALGSSMLKIALAPAASHIRVHWQRVMAQKELFWHEIQTKDDLIAFYKSDPFEQVGIAHPEAKYGITRIRFSKGMAKDRYRAMRKSFYRTHRQYILYYDKRVSFDYMLRLFGPLSVKTLALDDEAASRIDRDGRLG